jgi:uncharacterized protein (DUF2252 family)
MTRAKNSGDRGAAPAFRERWVDPAEVRARGVALREKAPPAEHAMLSLGPDRPDPVELVQRTNEGRVPDLAAVRVGRMTTSPFAFLRGSAAQMAADLAGGPSSGIDAQICGDAHASNFGFYASPERRLVMDVNDFDETVRGPWEWDVKRLLTSLVVAGREAGIDDQACRDAARDSARTYRAAVREVASMPVLDHWYLSTDRTTLERFDVGQLSEVFDRVEKKARKNTSKKAASKFTQRLGTNEWCFVEEPPVLTRVAEEESEAVVDGLEAYLETLPPERQYLLSRFSVTDVASRIVGLGSVGLRSYVVLLHGNGEDALILQVKEARHSALAEHLDTPAYPHEGERIVRGQKWTQTLSDILLGWTTIDGRPFLVRQFRDMKGSIDPTSLKPSRFDDYARVCGAVLGRAHARSADPRLLVGYCDGVDEGGGAEVDDALSRFAVSYADQTEKDLQTLTDGVTHGRIAATLGV